MCLRKWVSSVAALGVLVGGAALAGPTLGPTYSIAEPDTLDEIRRNAQQRDWRSWMKRQPAEYGAFQSASLPTAKRDRVRMFDPTYVLPNDITDENGKVMFPKGTRVNVYEKLKMRGRIIVVGASDAHFRWLEEVAKPTSDDKILLANGNVLTTRRNRKVQVFLLDDRGIERFGLKAVPTIVSQAGLQLKVEEYAVAP